MTAVLLVIATALVVTGAVAAAGTSVAPSRSAAAVAAGAVLLVVADARSLTAGATTTALATAGAPLLVALLGIVVLSVRPATVAALVGAIVAGPVRQLLDDPFRDPGCRVHCDPNPIAIFPDVTLTHAALVVGSAVLLLALLAPARPREPRTLLVAAVAVAAAPFVAGGSPAVLALAGGACVAVLVADLARATSTRARLADAVTSLGATSDPGRALTEALGGRSVVVGYPLGGESVVDSEGHPLGPLPVGWTVVQVKGPSAVVAEVRADLAGVATAALAHVLRGPARLALENNRLAAEAAVRAEEIRASAARLVDLAEQGRRRLERDLHDGAQRHVLTLGLAVQTESRLPEAVRGEAALAVRSVLDQLRDVAHGIRPPQLDTGGLARGLAVLADRSPVPLEVGPVPDGLEGPPAETAYRLVEEVLRTATGPVAVRFEESTGAWTLTVVATEGGAVPPDAGDRVRALGGTVRSQPAAQGWRHVASVVPRLP